MPTMLFSPRAIRSANGWIFSANGPWRHALALAADWSIPEPWGVWSSGNRPALVMWLGDIAPEAEYELRYKFIPYISPPILDSQTLTFILMGLNWENNLMTIKAFVNWALMCPDGYFLPMRLILLLLASSRLFRRINTNKHRSKNGWDWVLSWGWG